MNSIQLFFRNIIFKSNFLTILILSLIVFSCKEKEEEKPEPAPEGEHIDSDISTATTFVKNNSKGSNIYYINSRVTILAELIIDPGVNVVFSEGADFYIAENGSISAIGSENEKIRFIASTDKMGHWGGIYFDNNSDKNILEHCIVENAGNTDRSSAPKSSALIVYDGGSVVVKNSKISKSRGYGIYLYENALLPDFQNNSIKDCSTAPAFASLKNIHYFNASNDFSGNKNDHVDTFNSLNYLEGDFVWNNINVPYRLPSKKIDIKGHIEIKPGSSFKCTKGTALRVTETGSLHAVGSVNEQILFQGEKAESGYWGGFQINSKTPENSFNYVLIADAGGSNKFENPERFAAIELTEGASLILENSVIRNCSSPAIRNLSGDGLTENSNQFINNSGENIVNN